MLEPTIKFDLTEFERSLTDIEKRQLPYAIALTLTETAKGGRLEVQREMDKVFDRPTPYAKRGVVYDMATKQKLTAAVVVTGDRTKGGLPATAFLGPQIEGGVRTHKAFERQLIQRNLMDKRMVAVPAKRATLDRYGNMTQGFLNKVMADLQIDYRGAGATRVRTEQSVKRNKNYRKARYFVPKKDSHLYPGVYQRDPSSNVIFPVILFIPSEGYKIRLHLKDVVTRFVEANIHPNFELAFTRAVTSAR